MHSTAARKQSDLDVRAVHEIARIAKDLTGVQLGDRHFNMISSRLQGRIKALELGGAAEYLDYLRVHPEEQQVLIGTMTTHHTYFFREFAHFEFLAAKVVPMLADLARKRPDRTVRVWSAACSRGQEAYSLAMWLLPLLEPLVPGIKLEILGTDIDPESVSIARNGVYAWKEVKEIPLRLLSSSWSRGTAEISEFARAKSRIRSVCRFDTHNLLTGGTQPGGPFDVIFCRNVYIYFSPEQIRSATERLLKQLSPEGALFVGISESLYGLDLPLKSLGPSIYARPGSPLAGAAVVASQAGKPAVAAASPAAAGAVRVLIVEDSPSIQTLLKRVFGKEQGFEVVGVAKHGLEAAKLCKELRPDVMTLDIHMPEQNGIEYLRANIGPSHPPVVMISSVSREDQSLAAQALDLGACDYVEKPALADLAERSEEIRSKVRCALGARPQADAADKLALDRSFQKKVAIADPDGKARVVVFQGADRKRLATLLRGLSGPDQPPLMLVLAAGGSAGDLMRGRIEKELGSKPLGEAELAARTLKRGERCLLSVSGSLADSIRKATQGRDVSVLVLGEPPAPVCQALKSLSGPRTHILLEDLGARNARHPLKAFARDHSPLSGFAYLSDLHLCGQKK
jgi:chemotaxis protein methyltransferase CheR